MGEIRINMRKNVSEGEGSGAEVDSIKRGYIIISILINRNFTILFYLSIPFSLYPLSIPSPLRLWDFINNLLTLINLTVCIKILSIAIGVKDISLFIWLKVILQLSNNFFIPCLKADSFSELQSDEHKSRDKCANNLPKILIPSVTWVFLSNRSFAITSSEGSKNEGFSCDWSSTLLKSLQNFW